MKNFCTQNHPPTGREARVGIILLPAVVVLLFCGLYLFRVFDVADQAGFPLDDAWIHVRVAENLSEGHGFSLNKGVYCSVSTEPLWSILLALGLLFLKSPVVVASVFGIALTWFTCLYSHKLAFALTGDDFAASFASLIPAFLPFFTWGGLSGMGVPLFVMLTVMGLYFHVRFRSRSGLTQYVPTLVFALAALSRPECFLLFGFSTLDYLWVATVKERRPPSQAAGNVLRHVFLFALLTSPFFMFNYLTSGHLLPNTFYAKNIFWLKLNEGQLPSQGRAWFYFRAWLKYMTHLFVAFCRSSGWLLALLFPLGLFHLYRSRRAIKGAGFGIVPLVIFGYPLVTAAQNVRVFGMANVYGPQARYFTNLLVLWALVCALGIGVLRQSGRVSRLAASFLAAVVLCALAFKQWENSRTFAMNVKNVNEMNVAVARWVDENLPGDARLAVHDVGAIARFSDREIIDILGLASPEAWPYIARGQRGIFDFIKKTRPDYLIVFPKWFPLIVNQREYFRSVHRVSIDDNTIVGSDVMVVYECRYPPRGEP